MCPADETCGNIQDYPNLSFKSENYDQRSYLNFGVTNFDNLGYALLSVFQMITSETWYYQLMNLMDVDYPILGGIYVFSIIIIGQFFLLNLILAVIIQAFIKSKEQIVEDELKLLEQGNQLEEKDLSGSSLFTEEEDELK